MKRILIMLCLAVLFANGWAQTKSRIQKVEVTPGNSVNKRVYEMSDPGVVMPKFPGGMDALMNYLRSNIKYPLEAEKKGIEGRVFCAFVVGEDGEISDIEIRKSVDYLLDNEAERVIRSMPKWIPGSKDGWPMPVRFMLPISFRLNKKEPVDTLRPKEKMVVGENRVYDVTEEMPVFHVTEEMPVFPDGAQGLIKFLSENIKYPQESMKKGIQGRVIVSFVVDRDGSVTDPTIQKSVDPLLDAEALRVINMMPKWTPGRSKGVPVKVKYTIPVTFKL